MPTDPENAAWRDRLWLASIFAVAAAGFVLAVDVEETFWSSGLPEPSGVILVVLPLVAGLALKLRGVGLVLLAVLTYGAVRVLAHELATPTEIDERSDQNSLVLVAGVFLILVPLYLGAMAGVGAVVRVVGERIARSFRPKTH